MNEILVNKAIRFASKKHKEQMRRGSDVPYIMHLMDVFGFLVEAGCDDRTIIGGILHDVLEDTNATKEEIVGIFGEDIAELVESESEDKSKSWQERKQATIDGLSDASLATRQICCADKLSNILNIYMDREVVGEKVWDKFNADKNSVRWYYESIINALNLADFGPYTKLKEYYLKVFN